MLPGSHEWGEGVHPDVVNPTKRKGPLADLLVTEYGHQSRNEVAPVGMAVPEPKP